MKKYYFVLLLPLVFSCGKEIDPAELQDEPAVLTLYDQQVNFSDFASFYIPDSIGIVSDNTSLYHKDGSSAAQSILAKIRTSMESRGYTFTSKANAELGLNVTVLHQLNEEIHYAGYWWSYDGYYNANYWGYGYAPYYYGYLYDYSYETGSMLIEMVDLKHAPSTHKLKIIWNTEIGTIFSNTISVSDASRYIDEAFNQSPYIKR